MWNMIKAFFGLLGLAVFLAGVWVQVDSGKSWGLWSFLPLVWTGMWLKSIFAQRQSAAKTKSIWDKYDRPDSGYDPTQAL